MRKRWPAGSAVAMWSGYTCEVMEPLGNGMRVAARVAGGGGPDAWWWVPLTLLRPLTPLASELLSVAKAAK